MIALSSLQPYDPTPVSLDFVREHVSAKGTAAERRFLGRIEAWTKRGVRFEFGACFSPYNGLSLDARFAVVETLTSTSDVVSMSWHLSLPKFATTPLSVCKHRTALRFFGCGHEEQKAAFYAMSALESNARYPREGRHLDGFALVR